MKQAQAFDFAVLVEVATVVVIRIAYFPIPASSKPEQIGPAKLIVGVYVAKPLHLYEIPAISSLRAHPELK
jgi:hypothetical protein